MYYSVWGGTGLSDKCTVLYIASPTLLHYRRLRHGEVVQVRSGSHNLSVRETSKVLGIVLDRGLTFTNHLTFITQRAVERRLRGIYRFKPVLPEQVKLRLVQSLILTVLL